MTSFSLAPVQICKVPGGYVDITRGQSVMGEPPNDAQETACPNCNGMKELVNMTNDGQVVMVDEKRYLFERATTYNLFIDKLYKRYQLPVELIHNINNKEGLCSQSQITKRVEFGDRIFFIENPLHIVNNISQISDKEYDKLFKSMVTNGCDGTVIKAIGYEIPDTGGYAFKVLNDKGEYIGIVRWNVGAHYYGACDEGTEIAWQKPGSLY